MKRLFPAVLLLNTLIFGCKTDYANLPAYSENRQMQAVIEIPAGSAHQQQYNFETREFPAPETNTAENLIHFLPYPVNFGFVPSTFRDEANGGSGKPVAISVIGESCAVGTVLEVIPVGVLILDMNGELVHNIIAIPARPSEQTIEAEDFATFSSKYPAVKLILEKWFLNARPNTHLVGWKNEKFAEEQVQKWLK